MPIEVISKRLGHSDIGITYDRSITVYRDRDAEAAETFEDRGLEASAEIR